MDIPIKTLKSGFSLPVYGLGTWQMGGTREADSSNDAAEVQAIKAAIDHGITHIDTAELYGVGHSEELIGQAIKGYDRSKLLLASKVLDGMSDGYDGVLRACEASLKRLDTDYLDLYLLHRFPMHDIAGVMRAMDRLVDEKLVRNIGVCNMTIDRFEATQSHTNNKLVCNQLEYSLQIREAEARGIIKYCQDNDVFIVAWGPLSKGALEQADILQEMAEKYDKTQYQIALNWLISQKNVVTIPKTTQLAHLEENLRALGWELSTEDMDRLTREFPNQQITSQRVPLDYAAEVPV